MAEDQSNHINAISSFIEKNGISTMILCVVAYVGYTSFLAPASAKYMSMLDAVTESNVSLTATIETLKSGIVLIGEKNTHLGEKNSESLADIETQLRELEVISRDIDSKLNELKNRRYIPPIPEPVREAFE
jgi:peptidoglycan hydrolase CwlO-like protein